MNKIKKQVLNLAGKLAHTLLLSKLTLLLIISSVLFGLLAFVFIPKTYNPEIVVPVVNISISRPGSNSEEMLQQVVRPLEALMSAIPKVEHTYGFATNDQALVTVRFHVNENEETSLVKVYNQINSNLDHMPSGTFPPLIQSVSLYDVPLVTLTLSSQNSQKHNSMQLREIAEHVLEQLRSVPQVGKSWIIGSSPTAARVWLDPNKLAAYHLSIQNIRQILQGNNVGFESGKLDLANKEIPLQVAAKLIDQTDVAKIMVGTSNAKPVLLRDVARIELAPSDDNISSLFAFGPAAGKELKDLQPAVTIALARQKNSNGVEVAKAILSKLEKIKPLTIPVDVISTVTRNYGADASEAVDTLVKHLAISIAAVVFILLLFLGWREASIVTLSIPLILCVVIGVGWLFGQTLNRITLFALILSLGLLVDDSIVVIENIHRHMRFYPMRNFSRLIIKAANEIGRPTIIATFTVILALVPMAFVGGMMGPFMGPIPFFAPLAMLVSLIMAYSVVPYLAHKWLRKKALAGMSTNRNTRNTADKSSWLQKLYVKIFNPLMISRKKRHIFYSIIVGLLFVAMLQPLWQFIRPSGTNGPLSLLGVELKMLPDDNVNTFLVEIDADVGTPLSETHQVAESISQLLKANHFVENYQLFFGKSAPTDFAAMTRGDDMSYGSNYAQIRVNLLDKSLRKIQSHEILQQFYASLSLVRQNFPQVRIKLFETPPGPPVRSQMESSLLGPNYEVLRSLANYITSTIYPHIYGMINIDNSVSNDSTKYQIAIDQNAAIMSGFASIGLANELQAYFSGITVGSMHFQGAKEPYDIILRLPEVSRQSKDTLNKLYFNNRQDQLIPLSQVATFKTELMDKPIYTKDQQPVVYLTGEKLYGSPAYAAVSITSELQKHLFNGQKIEVGNLGFAESQPINLEKNQLLWQGEMRLTMDVFRDLGTAFIIALALIYLLLVGFYRSFIIPIIIMGAIPLTIIGVFPGHWLMHQPFTATSMIGVIALAGIVVRNSLLLIDFILEKQKQGYSLEIAVMEAGVARLLPILLTALAIILGSAIMLSDPVFSGLATALIFGAFASTLLTLFVIPLVYYGMIKRRRHTS